MVALTESFNKADADTLGPDQTWVEDTGDIDVVSNKARLVTAGFARPRSMWATILRQTMPTE
jgi:hypothetical protein